MGVFRLVVERNDVGSRSVEGLKQVRAIHVPDFESEAESTPAESGDTKPELGNETTEPTGAESDENQEAKKYVFIIFIFTNKDISIAAPDSVVSFVERHASGMSAKLKVDLLRGQVNRYWKNSRK